MEGPSERILVRSRSRKLMEERIQRLEKSGYRLAGVREKPHADGRVAMEATMTRNGRPGWYWTVWETCRGTLGVQEVKDTGHKFDQERRERGLYFSSSADAFEYVRRAKEEMKKEAERLRLQKRNKGIGQAERPPSIKSDGKIAD